MKCSSCQHDNPTGAKFCEECAAPLQRACANCSAPVSPTANFCPECAHPVGKTAAAPEQVDTPERYTPKHLAEKILTSKAALEGERKQVTVLFADLKGSMELLADRDPEEARRILDPVLERMMEAVHRYEGTVNQVMGDGIMALFGAPIAREDHAVRACYAALRMQEQISRYGDEMQRTHGTPIQLRVGLNSGEVVVRAIGNDLHMDYSAIGETTHLAARMEQTAKPGTVLITANTLKLVEGYVQVRSLGPVSVKGLTEASEVFELTGASAARTRLQAAAVRGLTRFVGRQRELEVLADALDDAGRAKGQVVAIVGEPGVGKSRLFYEVIHSHRTQGWLIVEAGSVSYGKATPYLPVIDLLERYFKIGDRDDARSIREKVTGKLLTLDRALEPLLAPLLALLDQQVEDVQWQGLDPLRRRRQTLDALKRLWLREAQAQPLILVFEDLHWIDSETQGFLDGLLESIPTASVLLLFNYRPEYQHPWGSKTYYTQLRLDPLTAETADDLLDSLLGSDPEVQPLKKMLVERTEGNPFFLEESVRSLVESRALERDRGNYRLLRSLASIEVPATVQAILAARIDRLQAEDKRLLQTAAVIGKDVPYALLGAIAELAETDLRGGLARLQAAEFLYEASLFPDLEYTFKHALTHEVAYAGVLRERRQEMHAGIVRAIEALYAARLSEHVERLAHHAFRAELWVDALTYLRQAGAKSLARSAYPQAVACFEQALTVLPKVPETRELLEQAIDIRFDLRTSLNPSGDLERIFGYVRETEELARALGDQRRLGWASTYVSFHYWQSGYSGKARMFGEQVQAIAESLPDVPLKVAGNLALATAYQLSGDNRRAETFFRNVVGLLEGDLSRERFGFVAFPGVMSRAHLAFSLAELGRFDEGIRFGRDGIVLAEAVNHPWSLVNACAYVAHLYRAKGDFGEAIRLLERALALARDWNLMFFMPLVKGTLGHVYGLGGRAPEGLSLLEEALKAVERTRPRSFHSLTFLYLAEIQMLSDRLGYAVDQAQAALTLAGECGQRAIEAQALRLLGEIAGRKTPPDAEIATSSYGRAIRLAEELGMRPLFAHCHFGLGKLYKQAGQRQQAETCLTTATTMYREMGMQCWLEKAEVEMKELA
jgi:class 3 adenylate cyclase/tetratricopeptide (TPR) repeat protein